MGRIEIDESLCQGTRECLALAGDTIAFDELGIARVADPGVELPDELVGRLVATCPSSAIGRVP